VADQITAIRAMTAIGDTPRARRRTLDQRESWKRAQVSGRFLYVPRKIRQLVSDLEAAGFVRVDGGKGSHRKFRHAKFPGFVLVSGHDGDDAQQYQEKQVRNALRHVKS
jgi:predicted RNA binding protein YcfA (HicA-like mRNA interferase family)